MFNGRISSDFDILLFHPCEKYKKLHEKTAPHIARVQIVC